MNRNLRLGTLATALLLAAAAMYVEPRAAHAFCICDTEGGSYVTDCWGKGSTPELATSNLPVDCRARANEFCGSDGACNVNSTLTAAPWWNGMTWQTDGYATFYCRICSTIEKEPYIN
jgi:hypothetical protein